MALKCHLHFWRLKVPSASPYILQEVTGQQQAPSTGFSSARLGLKPKRIVPAFFGEQEMKRKKHAMYLSDTSREKEVQQEIENFLNALSSYPDRFAREPRLSFHEHLFDIATASQQLAAGGRRRNVGH
jgi:hypothetical protein